MACRNRNCITAEEVHLYHIDLYSDSGHYSDEEYVREICENIQVIV